MSSFAAGVIGCARWYISYSSALERLTLKVFVLMHICMTSVHKVICCSPHLFDKCGEILPYIVNFVPYLQQPLFESYLQGLMSLRVTDVLIKVDILSFFSNCLLKSTESLNAD